MRVKWAPFCNFRGPFFKKGGPEKVFGLLGRDCSIGKRTFISDFLITSLAPVVQRVDKPIQRKNLFLLDKAIGFQLSLFLKTWGRMALSGDENS